MRGGLTRCIEASQDGHKTGQERPGRASKRQDRQTPTWTIKNASKGVFLN